MLCVVQEQEEPRPSPAPGAAPAPAVKTGQVNVASPVPDIFSSMLKDTTAEHRAHLFDLNCKICTGTLNLLTPGLLTGVYMLI